MAAAVGPRLRPGARSAVGVGLILYERYLPEEAQGRELSMNCREKRMKIDCSAGAGLPLGLAVVAPAALLRLRRLLTASPTRRWPRA